MVGEIDVRRPEPAGWMPPRFTRAFYAPNAPHSRRLMKGYLILLLQQLLAQHPGNVWS
ncbi:hypothetical protein KCP69_01565 [Salmonella enterica subsp. enterica]|nr:hypothetical protein KCP69_01565 [Salmonella enterica subsp. enterica]